MLKVVDVAGDEECLTYESTVGDFEWQTCTAGAILSFTLAGTSGSNQTITDGNTLTIAAGTGITTTGGATDTVTVAVDQATAFAWTGLQTHTNTLTATSSQSIWNITLGDDVDVDTISAIKVAATSATTGDADILYGIDIANLTSAAAVVVESALHIGSGWENAIDLNGVLISSTELGLLDGRSGTLVDSANVATYATTGVTAGNGLVTGGTVGVVTVDVGAGTCITVNADDVAITADCIGDTELAFNA